MIPIVPEAELIVNESDNVFKFVHHDGSETNIKLVPSCNTVWDETTGDYVVGTEIRNKYSVFISVSSGCFAKCNFCYLPAQQRKYTKLRNADIFMNVSHAISRVVELHPEIKQNYMKLCWMGMGDAYNVPDTVLHVTMNLADFVMKNKYAVGIDGVDISSIIPRMASKHTQYLNYRDLNRWLENYPTNPTHKQGRTPLRFFYSLHSGIQETRERMMPGTLQLPYALEQIQNMRDAGLNVVFHHILFDGVNDSQREVLAVMALWEKYNLYDCELRILRYNECNQLNLVESPDLPNIAKQWKAQGINVKVQISAGKEISAACGQFL